MKVLQVNCVYRKGSTGKITYNLHKGMLKAGIESVVCYGRGEYIKEPSVYKTCPEWYSKMNNAISRITGVMYGGCFFSTKKLISVIVKEKPDVVCLQCINGYFVNIYKLIAFLKKKRIPTVVVLHAEFMYTANCAHAYDCEGWMRGCGHCPRYHKETSSILFDNTALSWEKMSTSFHGSEANTIIVSVSPWLQSRAQLSPILSKHEHRVIFNGIDTNIFSPTINAGLLNQYKVTKKKIILHVTARFGDSNKGGQYVIQLAEKLGNDYLVLLVGKGLPSQKNVPQNVICVGEVSNPKELAAYYSISDVTVITSKRETFSMICAESLCCDTPVVGFCAGAPEQISHPDYSTFSKYGDIDTLLNNVIYWSNNKKDGKCARISKAIYDRSIMVDNYINIFEEVFRRCKK